MTQELQAKVVTLLAGSSPVSLLKLVETMEASDRAVDQELIQVLKAQRKAAIQLRLAMQQTANYIKKYGQNEVRQSIQTMNKYPANFDGEALAEVILSNSEQAMGFTNPLVGLLSFDEQGEAVMNGDMVIDVAAVMSSPGTHNPETGQALPEEEASQAE